MRTIARVQGTPVTVGNLLGVEAPGHPLVALRVGALADDPADDLLLLGDGDLSPCCREDPRALGRTDLPRSGRRRGSPASRRSAPAELLSTPDLLQLDLCLPLEHVADQAAPGVARVVSPYLAERGRPSLWSNIATPYY